MIITCGKSKVYKVIVLITYHENRECLIDMVKNIKYFLSDVFVLINCPIKNESFPEIVDDKCVLMPNPVRMNHCDHMIPIHINMKDYLIEHEIVSNHILLLASNQLFIRHGFNEKIENMSGAIMKRPFHSAYDSIFSNSKISNMLSVISKECFKFHSVHEGMIFKYEDFIDLMNLLKDYVGVKENGHHEEFVYAAYLMLKYSEEKLTDTRDYQKWPSDDDFPPWRGRMTMDDYAKHIKNPNIFLLKRVARDVTDPVRTEIRTKNNY